ncbi:MAG TPA: OB-fold nucleic acid binding domain-containing protein, partial [Chthonomonadales bacterium]|nr:OB-fold nucleic acid binding domain-containing protein [Chthonomonadales bacterium]
MIRKGEYIADLLKLPAGRAVTAHGWVKTRRDGKGMHFVQINDGSGFTDLQAVVEEGAIPEDTMRRVTTGACLRVKGALVQSPAAGQSIELKAEEIEI